jgi:hypothetical protein
MSKPLYDRMLSEARARESSVRELLQIGISDWLEVHGLTDRYKSVITKFWETRKGV